MQLYALFFCNLVNPCERNELPQVIVFRSLQQQTLYHNTGKVYFIKTIDMQKLFQTSNSLGPTVLRVFLGCIIWAHGAQKLLGWFQGFGFEGTMYYFTEMRGLPAIIGFLVIVTEFFGSIFLIAGVLTRVWSAAMVVLMASIIISTHWQYGFFMNWTGSAKGEGFEFFLLAMGMAASLTITGAGRFSIDAALQNRQPLVHKDFARQAA
jgi:putative oxidoreductase